MATTVSYGEMFTRNIGFVSPEEQTRLGKARVLILGVGGMGGAALETLVRSGVGRFIIADPDVFEVHNLNRQVFSDIDRIGASKVASAKDQAEKINPHVQIETFSRLEGDDLRRAIARCDVVINGCDDPRASIELHRLSSEAGKVTVDALAALLPNVVVCQPGSGGIEALLRSPTECCTLEELTAERLTRHVQKEIEFVMVHSSSLKYAHLPAVREFLTGQRKRFSFAPMVVTTGNLMAFEAIRTILSRAPVARRCSVYFLNPWTQTIERRKRGWRHLVAAFYAWRAWKKLTQSGST